MNNSYGDIAHLFQRLGQLSPKKLQLLELLIKQENAKSASADDSSQELQSYKLNWHPLSLTDGEQSWTNSNWLIFADSGYVGQELAQKLEAKGDRVILVFPGSNYEKRSDGSFAIDPAQPQHFQRLLTENPGSYRGAIHLWNLDENSENPTLESLSQAQVKGCGSVLHLVQALTGLNSAQMPKLWVVTRGAVSVGDCPQAVRLQSAAVWGLSRTIALEHPELQCTCLDLDKEGGELEFIWQQISSSSSEDRIAQRQGKAYSPRLTVSADKTAIKGLKISENATYLVTGGLGGLGIELAKWLVGKGARSLVLVGRSGAASAAQSAIAQLEAKGAKVTIAQADIGNRQQVESLLAKIQSLLPPLRGIIHAAGILDDGILSQLTWQRFEKVMQVKMGGAWNLHQLTQNTPLDFFVCFSSITSLLGNAGQGNYAAANAFLDALAYYRKSLGLPGLTVNWGPWGEVGMAAKMGDREQTRLSSLGIRPIAPTAGMAMLGNAIAGNEPQIAVIDINWAKYLQQFSPDSQPPLLSNLAVESQLESAASNAVLSPAAVKQQLQAGNLEQRQQVLTRYLQNLIGQFLGYDSANPPDAFQSLNELGLDSLTSIQVRNKVKSELEIDLPLAKFMGDTNIDLLAKNLQEQYTALSLLSTAASNDTAEEEEEMEEITI